MTERIRRYSQYILLAILTLIFFMVGAVVWFVSVSQQPIVEKVVQLVVPKGASITTVSRILNEYNVTSDTLTVKWLMRIASMSPQAGLYEFKQGETIWSALRRMDNGDVSPFLLTIPEGMLTSDIIRRVNAHPYLKGKITEIFPEGVFLPETYFVDYGTDRTALLHRMQSDMVQIVSDIWKNRDKTIPIKTPQDMVILASIVEMETALHDEKPMVAGVYLNRIKKRMHLNADPTVAYGINRGREKLSRPLSRRDLKTVGVYNTYLNYGLPPTPIANPGRASLIAVANPKKTKYLYFVADGTGGHVFAKTYREHLKNVARWRHINKK